MKIFSLSFKLSNLVSKDVQVQKPGVATVLTLTYSTNKQQHTAGGQRLSISIQGLKEVWFLTIPWCRPMQAWHMQRIDSDCTSTTQPLPICSPPANPLDEVGGLWAQFYLKTTKKIRKKHWWVSSLVRSMIQHRVICNICIVLSVILATNKFVKYQFQFV